MTIEQVISHYHEPLYWFIRRMVVSHDDAQDVLQDTFLQVHLHIDELRQAESERSWIYRVATNQALMWLRSRHEFLSLDDEDATPLIETLYADSYTDTSERLPVLFQEAILSLPTIQRTVFNLRYYDEMPYEEIASVIHSTVGSVKTSYHYAKDKISQYILAHS